MKKRNLSVIGLAAALCVTIFAIAYAADDEKEEEGSVAFASLPEAVKKAATAYFGSADGLEAGKETEHGAVLYEIEGKKNGADTEIELSEAGDLIEVESATSFDKLPAAAQAALKKKYPSGKFTEVESHQINFYEVEVDGKEVSVSASGGLREGDDD